MGWSRADGVDTPTSERMDLDSGEQVVKQGHGGRILGSKNQVRDLDLVRRMAGGLNSRDFNSLRMTSCVVHPVYRPLGPEP